MRIVLGLGVGFLAVASAAAQQIVKPVETESRAQSIRALDDAAARETAARRARIASIHTRQQAQARQAQVRAAMLRLIGPLPERTPLNAQMLGETRLDDGIRVQKILFDSQPGFHVTALLYLPAEVNRKLPAIVMAPGHGATGKAGDFASASTFARNGFAVLSYDPIGQGERLQYPDPAEPTKSLATRPTGEHAEAGLQPVLIGESVAKYFLWDGMRAVDYLESREEVDPKRIGAYGCSGGGAMTALLGALDTRIAAVGTACYITSFDTLLASIGPQDGEQSTPGWIAAGLDFPDWVEVAAPRPYAIIATSTDMFPYAGAASSAAEAREFYALFDPASNGKPKEGSMAGTAVPVDGNGPPLWIPDKPTLNPDTISMVPAAAALQFIVGQGGHGNLKPLQGDILSFFLLHLAHLNASPLLPSPTAAPAKPSAGALQVTSTGQVSTAYPGSATVFSLNLEHAATLPNPPPLPAGPTLKAVVRKVTGAAVLPGAASPESTPGGDPDPAQIRHRMKIATAPGIEVDAEFYRPASEGKHPVLLVLKKLCRRLVGRHAPGRDRKLYRVREGGHGACACWQPRPSNAGGEDRKSPILGDFYMLGLRAELAGKTLLGMRVDGRHRVHQLPHDRRNPRAGQHHCRGVGPRGPGAACMRRCSMRG